MKLNLCVDCFIITWQNTGAMFRSCLHTSTTSDQNIANSTRDEVWAQVEKDLTDAATMLPVNYDDANVGRATRGAAYALLGKAYMQQKKYQQAALHLHGW